MQPTLKPIRISIISERYEVAASLFDSVYGDLAEQVGGNVPPTPMTPAEEMTMGIFSDEVTDDYFVKPADPAVTRAKATGQGLVVGGGVEPLVCVSSVGVME